MNHKLAVVAFVTLLTGCSSTDMQSSLGSLRDLGKSLSQGAGDTVGLRSAPGVSLTETSLQGVFRQNLSANGEAPEWPKVAILNLKIPADQLDYGRSFSLKPNECIRFDAMLWRSTTSSERFTDLRLCATELPKQSNDFVLVWKSFPISGKTTGQIRTEGPTPPYSKLPGDPDVERWLVNQFGLYYIGSLLTLLGYDPSFAIDDRRFWVTDISH